MSIFNRIVLITMLAYSNSSDSGQFSNNSVDVEFNFKKGELYDGGDIAWKANYCGHLAKYNCFITQGFWFGVAIPKSEIALGDYWYFAGHKYHYVANFSENEILVVRHISESLTKKYPNACVSCMSFVRVKNKSRIVSIIIAYENSEKMIDSDIWKYSEGNFDISKIPKEFPVEQIYSADEVDKLSKSDWTPE
ncbi:hypothetical protein CBP51_00525 [Cellvibrio mixtus]|uniref:Uncharacterized protein n=1 Tax=Cellvibrio mixtus TaxID=39650 RepID=A0A266Q6R3_9GAMM|nr:hypothetical protein [Cellvibrio mixtus]OZY85573.1 hypothetical protein CBP51_00525 [Cellvibrio mixtus]